MILAVSNAGMLRRATGAVAAGIWALSVCPAQAGNGANFVLYDHHTESKGTTEIKVYNDLGRTEDGVRYNAQLVEFEHALTDQWVLAAYLESHKESGDDWDFDGFRFETRYRLFDYGTPFNPVVYVEYVNKKEGALYLREAMGRTDEEEHEEAGEAGAHEEENEREHEIESKLILGHDVSDRLRIGFDWINEVNLKNGNWEFGYAAGLTYTLFKAEGGHEGGAHGAHSRGFDVEKVQLGFEMFGGLGDSVKGLTLDGSKTQQYAGLNLKTKFENGTMVMLGGAFGLTDDSQDAIFRAMVGVELE